MQITSHKFPIWTELSSHETQFVYFKETEYYSNIRFFSFMISDNDRNYDNCLTIRKYHFP